MRSSPTRCTWASFFCPVSLAPGYPRRPSLLPPWQIGGALLVLAAITALALALWRKRPYLLVGWLWYVGMLVPVIGLMQFAAQAEADRYTYLPQIGLTLALVWTAADAWGSRPQGGKGDRHLLCDDQRRPPLRGGARSVPAEGPFRQKVPVPFSAAIAVTCGLVILVALRLASDVLLARQ